jgi:hypothetical protein
VAEDLISRYGTVHTVQYSTVESQRRIIEFPCVAQPHRFVVIVVIAARRKAAYLRAG